MANNTVTEFARELKVSADTLLSQLKSAGVQVSTVHDEISDADKRQLLDSLRQERVASPRKITVTRRETSTIRQNDGQGGARTIEVEVRRRRVFVKNRAAEAMRAEIEAQAKAQLDRQLKENRKQRRLRLPSAKLKPSSQLKKQPRRPRKKPLPRRLPKKKPRQKRLLPKLPPVRPKQKSLLPKRRLRRSLPLKRPVRPRSKPKRKLSVKPRPPRKLLRRKPLLKRQPPRRPSSKLVVRKLAVRLRKRPMPFVRCSPSQRQF